MLIAFAKDVRADVVELNEINTSRAHRKKLQEKLYAFVQFHADAKQLSLKLYVK